MSQLKLRTSQVLQGEFHLKELNLLLVFQVNCPGCFVYALPLVARLHHEYGEHLNVLGLSTAFEDFNLNTVNHTQRLLATGEIVGATQLYFQHRGQTAYQNPISFPVAFDKLGDASELFDHTDIDHICRLAPSFGQMDADTQARSRQPNKSGITSLLSCGLYISGEPTPRHAVVGPI